MRMSSLEDANKTPKKHRFQYIRDSVFRFSFSVNALKTAFFLFGQCHPHFIQMRIS